MNSSHPADFFQKDLRHTKGLSHRRTRHEFSERGGAILRRGNRLQLERIRTRQCWHANLWPSLGRFVPRRSYRSDGGRRTVEHHSEEPKPRWGDRLAYCPTRVRPTVLSGSSACSLADPCWYRGRSRRLGDTPASVMGRSRSWYRQIPTLRTGQESPHLLYSPFIWTSYATGEKAVYSSFEGGLATDGGQAKMAQVADYPRPMAN
jgi:hypothetical protein